VLQVGIAEVLILLSFMVYYGKSMLVQLIGSNIKKSYHKGVMIVVGRFLFQVKILWSGL
jgi:hypothetical protein